MKIYVLRKMYKFIKKIVLFSITFIKTIFTKNIVIKKVTFTNSFT